MIFREARYVWTVTVRVGVIEADRATREGLERLISQAEGLAWGGGFDTAEAATSLLPGRWPEVLLVEVDLPGRNGIDCVRTLKHLRPSLEVLMLTASATQDRILSALRAGASGYLLKGGPPREILEAIHQVHAGGSPFTATVARQIVNSFQSDPRPAALLPGLTGRENEILGLLACGLQYKEIGEQLVISTSTVRAHLHTIYRKLRVQSRTEAVVKYLRG